MKKIIIMIICSFFVLSNVESIYAFENNNENDVSSVTNLNVEGNVINFEYDNDKVSYNVDTELITINDSVFIQLKTTVESSILPEHEALEIEKNAILEKFTALENNDSTEPGIVPFEYSVTGIPSNADYVVESNFSKEISQIVGDLGSVLQNISGITDILFSCPAIPYSDLLQVASTAIGLTGYALESLSTVTTGTWKYQIQRTKKMYTVGITTQYGRRYAHSSISLGVKALGKNYTLYKNASNKRGGWWVTQKPF